MGTIAGILLILMSIAHNIYGEKKQIPDLKAIGDDPIMIGSLRIMIYQGGILLFLVGVIQILASLNLIELVGIAKYFPLGIIILNIGTMLILSITLHKEILKISGFQLIVFTIIIILMLLAI